MRDGEWDEHWQIDIKGIIYHLRMKYCVYRFKVFRTRRAQVMVTEETGLGATVINVTSFPTDEAAKAKWDKTVELLRKAIPPRSQRTPL